MDNATTIDTNLQALKRFVVSLFAMAGLADADNSRGILTRNVRNALLRLLRPAESAARRLIVIAAQGFVAPPLRERKPTPPKYVQSVITMHGGVRSRLVWKAGAQFPQIIPLPPEPPAARLPFPLFDPLRRIGQRRWIKQSAEPRIRSLDADPAPLPKHDNEPTGARIGLRLEALARVLDDLPRQALRYVRWKARRDKAINEPYQPSRFLRLSPLRSGRPPGARRINADYYNPVKFERSPKQEIDDILTDLHNLARRALETSARDARLGPHRDTS